MSATEPAQPAASLSLAARLRARQESEKGKFSPTTRPVAGNEVSPNIDVWTHVSSAYAIDVSTRRGRRSAGAEVRPPVVVYTDARYSPNEAEPAQIGVVIYDPTDAAAPWRHSDLVIDEPTMARFAPKQQYVGPLEVLGGVAPYSSLPEVFRGRDVIHFIDNTGALFGLAQGSSSDPDSARLIHAQHSLAAALDVNVWYEYVASGANIADLPSRGEFDLLEEMQSVRFEITLPVIGGDWSAVYADIFGRFAPRPTKGDKRRRAAIVAALASERKRARAE